MINILYSFERGSELEYKKERLLVIYTNDCKISRLWGAASSLTFNKSLSNSAVLLISRRSFKRCRWIFLNLSMSKVERKKTLKMSIFYLNFCLMLELSLVWKLPVASSLTRGLSLIKSSTVKCIGVGGGGNCRSIHTEHQLGFHGIMINNSMRSGKG